MARDGWAAHSSKERVDTPVWKFPSGPACLGSIGSQGPGWAGLGWAGCRGVQRGWVSRGHDLIYTLCPAPTPTPGRAQWGMGPADPVLTEKSVCGGNVSVDGIFPGN